MRRQDVGEGRMTLRTTLDRTKEGCQCRVCVLTWTVQAVQEKLSPEDRAVIEDLLNCWTEESMDAGRNDSFLKGHWPGTKPIAETACSHAWERGGDVPAKWDCECGARVYRSYEDYCEG